MWAPRCAQLGAPHQIDGLLLTLTIPNVCLSGTRTAPFDPVRVSAKTMSVCIHC